MNIVNGNLVSLSQEGHFDVIFHACHCQCYMYSGVAKAISDTYPEAFEADRRTRKDDTTKLGGYTHAVCQTLAGDPLVIFNLYVQRYYGRLHYQQNAYRYDLLAQSLSAVHRRVGNRNLRFGFPQIGGQRGKADIEKVNQTIVASLPGENLTLVRMP